MVNPIRIVKLFRMLSGKRIAFAIMFLFLINYSFGQPNPTAFKGVLNLQHHNWVKEGLTDLNGQWEFYWNSLYAPSFFDSTVLKPSEYANVPDFWSKLAPDNGLLKPAFGYATYRLKVLCPPSNERLALKFLTVPSAYKLFINGKQIAEVGRVGKSKEATIPAFQPMIVPVMPINNELTIIIQVANFTYHTGGLWDTVKLGTDEQINNYYY